MPLSEKEQRILDELEKQLRSEDPGLDHAFRERPRRSVDKTRVVLAALGVAAGLGLLIFSVWVKVVWLGVLAFVVMLLSLTFGMTGSAPRTPAPGDPRREHPAFGGGSREKRSRGSKVMRTLEARWDRREGGNRAG